MSNIDYNLRQKEIMRLVREHQPITSEDIATHLNLSRSTIRSDLSILTKSGILDAKPKVGYIYLGISSNDESLKNFFKTKVSEVMSLPVVLDEKVSVYDAIVTMFLENTGSIYIINDGYLSGIVSRKDIIKTCIGGADIKDIPVGVIMTRMPNVVVSHTYETITDAADKIVLHEIDSLPVVEEDVVGDKKQLKIVGKISKTILSKLIVEVNNKLEG